jgi:hypothetical protein
MFESLPDQKRDSITHGCRNSSFDCAQLDSSPTSEGESMQHVPTLFPGGRWYPRQQLGLSTCSEARPLFAQTMNSFSILEFFFFFWIE